MTATATRPAGPTEEFPEDDVRAILHEWFAFDAPDDPFAQPNTLAASPIALDSLRAVTVLLTVEERIGIDIPITVIKRGGYHSETEMLEHLIPRIKEHYDKLR